MDERHPVDFLEPEEESSERGTPPTIMVVEAVARTFFTGNPKITLVSWRIMLGDDWDSIRACARRAGCTAAATFGNWRGITPAHLSRPLGNPGWLIFAPRGGILTLRWRRCRKSNLRRDSGEFEKITEFAIRIFCLPSPSS